MPTTYTCVLTRTYVPIYGQYLNILVKDDYNEYAWRDLMTDKYTPNLRAIGSVFFDAEEGEGFLAIRADAGPGTVAHEAAHLTTALLNFVGVKLDPDNDEPFCYLLAWVVEQVEHARAQPPTQHRIESPTP